MSELFDVVVLTLILSIAASYLRSGLDILVSLISGRWKSRIARNRADSVRYQELLKDPEYRANARFRILDAERRAFGMIGLSVLNPPEATATPMDWFFMSSGSELGQDLRSTGLDDAGHGHE